MIKILLISYLILCVVYMIMDYFNSKREDEFYARLEKRHKEGKDGKGNMSIL